MVNVVVGLAMSLTSACRDLLILVRAAHRQYVDQLSRQWFAVNTRLVSFLSFVVFSFSFVLSFVLSFDAWKFFQWCTLPNVNVPVKIQFCQVQKLLQLWQHKDLNLQYFWIPVHRTEECFQVHWEQLGQFYCPWLLTNHTEEEYSPAVPRTWKGFIGVQIE